MFEIFASPDAWVALLTLTFLEIVLGVDNIVFISLTANKLPEDKQKNATNLGLILAMVQRIILLFLVSMLVALKKPFTVIDLSWFHFEISGQALILLVGGLFLLYKSTSEIHEKLDQPGNKEKTTAQKTISSLGKALVQIMLIDFIFSIDSILTAIGMTSGISDNPDHALILMIIAVVVSILIMMSFANAIREFISKHPSMQLLALSFLILIGFMLITEAAHLGEAEVFDQKIGAIPKGYLYFAIAFSLLVEFLKMNLQKKKKVKQKSAQ